MKRTACGGILRMHERNFLVGAKTVGVIKTDETISKREFRKRWTDEELS